MKPYKGKLSVWVCVSVVGWINLSELLIFLCGGCILFFSLNILYNNTLHELAHGSDELTSPVKLLFCHIAVHESDNNEKMRPRKREREKEEHVLIPLFRCCGAHAITTRHCSCYIPAQLCTTTTNTEAPSPHHPLRNLSPFHRPHPFHCTQSASPIVRYTMMRIRTYGKCGRKYPTQAHDNTEFTYLILTRGQRRRRDVDNSSTAQL